MDIVIITGASRGLGEALATALTGPERRLICIARSPNDALAAHAKAAGGWLDYYLHDIGDLAKLDALADAIFADLPRDAAKYLLINNAATVDPVGTVGGDTPANAGSSGTMALDTAMAVNLTAAMALSSHFLAATKDFAGKRQIVNISSGAARTPLAGWSAYCASKAGLEMFTRCVNLEQATCTNPARAVALSPGVIDTAMQARVRASSVEDFSEVARFREMKASGQLASPADTARRIIALIAHKEFGTREIDDIRNYPA